MKKSLVFDGKVFSKAAILSTCYWMADKTVADISDHNGEIVVDLKGRNGFVVEASTIDEFKTMAVHNQLRHQLKEKFASLETAIIEKAFRPVSQG